MPRGEPITSNATINSFVIIIEESFKRVASDFSAIVSPKRTFTARSYTKGDKYWLHFLELGSRGVGRNLPLSYLYYFIL